MIWLLPFARWLLHWRQKDVLQADLLGGLTGAIMVLPQGVAFATLAGMPPAYGLYAAMGRRSPGRSPFSSIRTPRQLRRCRVARTPGFDS